MTLIKNKELSYIYLLLIIALLLRIFWLYNFTPLYNQDELSNLYDAISMSLTGYDRWKSPSPFIFKSFGPPDYRPFLFIYIELIFYKLFQIGEIGSRFISIFFSILGLIYSYLIVKLFLNRKIALICLFVISFLPIHIRFSNIAFESSSMSSTISLLGLYYLLRYSLTNKKESLYLSIFWFGIAPSAYQSCKLTSILVTGLIFLGLLYYKKWREFIVSIIIFSIILIPHIILIIDYPELYFARALNTIPHFSNFYLLKVAIEFFSSLNPIVMFGSENIEYNLTYSRFLLIEFPLFVIGLFVINKIEFITPKKKIVLLVSYLIFALPEAITLSSINLYRSNLKHYFMALIIAIGIYYISEKKWVSTKLLLFSILINFTIVAIASYNLPSRLSGFQVENKAIFSKLNEYKGKYSNYYIESIGNQPYIYLLYYCHISPVDFHKAKIVNKGGKNWDDIRQVNNYFLCQYNELNMLKRDTNNLIISHKKISNYIVVDSIISNNRIFYFLK